MADLNIDYRHPAYSEFLPEWEMIGDCVNGERVIKNRGRKYLPHPATDEKSDDRDGKRYDKYKARAAFINATGRTLSGLLGIAFNKPAIISISGPDNLVEIEKDADGEGQPLTQLIRDALSQNLQRGRAGLLTDFTTQGMKTVEKSGRPILRLFTAKQIINWRVTGGKTTLVVLKWQEPLQTDGFELVMFNCWLELRIINNIAYSRMWSDESGDILVGDFVALTDGNGLTMSELPWSWIGSVNNDHTPDPPPLSDIAYVNIKHYQNEADLAESAHLVGQPMIALTGLTQQWIDDNLPDGFVVGSRKGVSLPVGGDMKFAQPEERGVQMLLAERRERQMAMLGAKLIERGTSARTATQASDEAQTDNSVLSLCAGNVEQAFNRAFGFAIAFTGHGDAHIELNKTYEISAIDSSTVSALLSAVQSNNMPLSDFISYLQSVGAISDKKTVEQIEQDLRDSAPNLLE
ncbi:DUF4055 domain-containing protein [Photorhabdus luminescens]|uniref:DUF4055 domain-containing protein n=1 Tax=Photorhabdus luminescens TaxID=29488 RepID=UPI00223FBD38|nr:DUF4055 domain-containing protein [Photorhabdus luminescens]MCW7764303.1 DUF4055 domain-containing protein [Photorhabdus luminescens subsp. venezuelensis]